MTACVLALLVQTARPIDIADWYSPHNSDRPRCRTTYYILLHTTEGPRTGSLNKVHRNGEAHYFVDEQGKVYRIVAHRRVAFHAGRSMWNARTDLDRYSIGIEVVGYHDRNITDAQYLAIRELLVQLQRMYRVSDDRVLTHSMVAYGAPNRWHRRSHRGRKRCGMLFADAGVRSRLGLKSSPGFDPDVRAGRLAVGDSELARVLYGGSRMKFLPPSTGVREYVITAGLSAWDVAREQYDGQSTLYLFPGGTTRRGDQIKNWAAIPAGTRIRLGDPSHENAPEGPRAMPDGGESAAELAGDEADSPSTLYLLPDGTVRRGDSLVQAGQLAALPAGTRVFVGYDFAGPVTARHSAFDICGVKWRSPSTHYRLPDGSLVAGDRIRENAIPRGTWVFFRK